MIAQGLVVLVAGGALALVVRACGRGDRGGVWWFDLARPVNRAARRRAR